MVKLNQSSSVLSAELPALSEAELPALSRRLSDRVEQALQTLPPLQQAALDLRFGLRSEGLSAAQAAAEFGTSPAEVAALAEAALRALYAPR